MPVVGITHDQAGADRHFSPGDLARLRTAAEVRVLGPCRDPGFADRLADVEVLLGSWGMARLDAALLAKAPRLRAICYAAGSVKGFVTDESYARGVVVTTAMHANALPVVEWTLAIMTLASKNGLLAMERIRAGKREAFHVHEPACTGMYDITVGIIGFGAVGRLMVERLRDFAVRIAVHDPYADPVAIAAAGGEAMSLLELAAASHIVSLHAPDLPQTRGMISRQVFAAMRTGSIFINTARGRLVDEAALIDELRAGRISAYLDVTHPEPPAAGSPLYDLPNCWLSPHRAGSYAQEVRRMGRFAIDECLAILAGRAPRAAVTQAMLATMA